MTRVAWGAATILIALLGYWLFPGHTYLQSDTQIYVPMMDRLKNPALFEKDIMVTRPHLNYTVYDEVSRALTRLAPLSIEHALKFQQLVCRSLFVAGIFLIALRMGLEPLASWFVAALASLGAIVYGPAVLTLEYEPVPRGFAVGLLVLGIGLVAHERYRAAGIAAAIALLYHPTTTAPFWLVSFVAVARRRAPVTLLAPLAPAVALLLLLSQFQQGVTEPLSVFRRLDSFQLDLQRMRAPYDYVSAWNRTAYVELVCQCAVVAAGLWRIRDRLKGSLFDFFWGMPLVGLLCVPLSWVLLEWQHWALIPVWQPARATLFVTLMSAILSSAAGLIAIERKRLMEAAVWLVLALMMPIKSALYGWSSAPALIGLACGLALLLLAGAYFAKRTHGAALIAAGLLPYFVFPASGLIHNYPHLETPDVDRLAEWAHQHTAEDAVFLFADIGTGGEAGIFRARSQRALYVDWKGGGQVNYFPEFAKQWSQRWDDTRRGRWNISAQDFQRLAGLPVDYVVVRAQHALPERKPEFSDASFVVYRMVQ